MYRMRPLTLSFLLLSASFAHGQYAGPESVEYDPVGDRYFVSCTDDNSIRQRAQDGTVSVFVEDITGAPYGIELKGDTLVANVGGRIKGYLTSDGTQVFDLNVTGTFLNGLTTDGHFLYAADFSEQKVFKVDPDAGTFSTLVADTDHTPNGIVYDPTLDRLWVAFWGSNARIKSYDRNTGAELSTFTTSLGNIDGITLDCEGRILVSSWSPNRISRFEPTFTAPAENLQSSGLSSPADIDYDAVNNRVCVPNAGTNTVVLPEVAGCAVGVLDVEGYRTVNAVPNPTDGLVRIELEMQEPQPFMVLTEGGLLVATGTLRPNAFLDVRSLEAGVYLIDLPKLKRYVRVVKR